MSLAIFIYTKLPCVFFFFFFTKGTINILAITALGQDGSQEIDLAGCVEHSWKRDKQCRLAGLSSHEGNQRLGRWWGSRAPGSWRLGLERYKWDEQSRRLPDSTSQGKN